MSEAKFTPGPWWVEDRRGVAENRGGGCIQVQARHCGEGSSYCVASVNFWEAKEANASLIAAAPDLYEALSAMDRVMAEVWKVAHSRDFTDEETDALRKMRDALAKAEGRS